MVKVRFLQILLLVLALNLGFMILWGSNQESIIEAFSRLFPETWFKITLFDLYLGLILFSLWVLVREPFWKAALWIIGFIFLGNFLTAIYTIWSLNRLKKETKLSDWFVGLTS